MVTQQLAQSPETETLISVVTPVYGCKACLPSLYNRLKGTLDQITPNWEIIMVNDASPDLAWPEILALCNTDSRVKGINLSRNFGQHFAITAGLDHTKGAWVVVMDCDLQDQPEELLKMYNHAIAGDFDVVQGRRAQRKDTFLKKLSSDAFTAVFSYLIGFKLDNSIGNYSISKRVVIEAFRTMREQNRSFPLFLHWLGFKKAAIDIEHAKREEGKSSYTFAKLLQFALSNILAYSNKPLMLSIRFGLGMAAISFSYGLYVIIKYFVHHTPVAGWTSMMVSLYFLTGLMFANLGLLGLYIGQVFNGIKGRPIYVIKEVVN